MKAAAARQENDGDDLGALAPELNTKTTAQSLDLVERLYHPARLLAKTQLLLEGITEDRG